jgi:hypothetical protein
MLNADLNARYWTHLFDRYSAYEKWSQLFLAFTSSSTVAAWTLWSSRPTLWKVLSALSTLAALALPILNWRKLVPEIADQRARWIELRSAYEALWFDVEKDDFPPKIVEKEFKRSMARQAHVEAHDNRLPFSKTLMDQCEKEVIAARQRANGAENP